MSAATEFKPVSLMDRIKQATTEQELFALFNEGEAYKYASPKTRRRWSQAIFVGRQRIAQELKESKVKNKKK